MSVLSANLPALPRDSGDSLNTFLREAWKFPMLSADEEYMLAKRFHDSGDVDAAHKLVTSHLRLVAKIAMGYKGYGLPVADLISEGNVGLMKAVKKFEPEKGFRLSTYAMWWIRASVTEYILQSWSMVRLGTMAAQKKLFFSLRRTKNKLEIMDNGELTPDQAQAIANETNATPDEVRQLNRRLASRDMSLNAPLSIDEGGEHQDLLEDDRPNPEHMASNSQISALRSEVVGEALENLNERDRDIFERRHLSEEPPTLEELGMEYGISRERVRQLEARAFGKVKEFILGHSVAPQLT
ncbi:RNA polymerase sigma factor RpoH [Candidatus Terasakiella magnetica]|uniref:RNA polymerase sigma factor n=1 Tax=Candidatus Terasakiella magnetica TaxID=1867952 RepID=A0A1C3RF06_9PROT|nr:RNA polymerase sigma factor RpoH [Candidatus Terasakiella magnetica]SCA55841.1 RNA polymerase sigma factor RpoH [Candidatus Terasakiella magnetica]